MPLKLTNEIIDAAIEGFEAQKRRIDDQMAELRGMRSGSPVPALPALSAPAKGLRRKMSAAGRKGIAEGQRKRWAGRAEPQALKAKAAKKKRVLSAEGKAAIVAALKKRWAAKKAAAKK